MAVEFTTATIVRSFLKGAGTSLTDAEIEEHIEQVEGHLKVILRIPSTFTFSSANKLHKSLRMAVSAKTAMIAIASTSQSFNTLEQAALALDVLDTIYTESIYDFKFNPGNRDYVILNEE